MVFNGFTASDENVSFCACLLAVPIGSAQEVPTSLKFVLFVGNTDARSVIVKKKASDEIKFLFVSCFHAILILVAVQATFMKMTGGQWTT